MAFRGFKFGFMTGVDYITHQQQHGENNGSMQMFNRRLRFGRHMYHKDLYSHYGCVNAIEFSNDGEWMISGGDDKRVLLWNVGKTVAPSVSHQPKFMKAEHNSNIFCLAFSKSQTKVLSSGNDEQVILHDVNTGESLDVFLHDEAVYGISADPSDDNMFATSCDDGRVLIWDIRQSTNDPFTLANNATAYHAVMHNPAEPRFLATANAKEGVCLWDVRKPKECMMKYGSSLLNPSAMSVRFNATGTHILALRRRLPPVLYDITSIYPAAEFDHPEYYNSCTMKSCCFAGERDQYVLSGSDDFKLYIWKIPDSFSKKGMHINQPHFVLRGHRSIVNQVRYNNTYGIIASSGVEKIIKLWGSFPLSYSEGSNCYVKSKDHLRKVYTHEEYINLVLHSGQFMTHDYSHRSTREDPRMMAFFDSLVQRDIEGWTSDSSDAAETTTSNATFEVQSSESSSTTCSSSTSDDELQNIAHISKRSKLLDTESNQTQDQAQSTNEAAASNLLTNRRGTARRLFNTGETSSGHSFGIRGGASRRLFSSRESANRRLFSEVGVANRLFPNREGSTCSIFDTRLSTNVNSDDEEFDPALDRISLLIAQKRRVQKLKMDRKSMKKDSRLVRKRYKLIKKHMHKAPADQLPGTTNYGIGFIPVSPDTCNPVADSTKDKRKLLRRKRAKMIKKPNLESKSSDSDENVRDCDNAKNRDNGRDTNTISDDNSGLSPKGSASCIEENFLQDAVTSKKDLLDTNQNLLNTDITSEKDSPNAGDNLIFNAKSAKKDSSTTNENLFLNAIASLKDSSSTNRNLLFSKDKTSKKVSNDPSALSSILSSSMNTGLNVTEPTVASDNSNSSVCFPNSGARHNGRNYRKRKSEDANED